VIATPIEAAPVTRYTAFMNSNPTSPRSTFAPKAAFAILAVLLGTAGSARADERGIPWVRVVEHAPWQARDSQGEVVFKDRLWVLGGWFNSFEAPPRDVWSSADGRDWQLETSAAPWKHSDLPMTLVYNDRMWIMGGWYNGRLPGHSASNEVWASSDGKQWEQVTPRAGWSPRLAAAAVVFKGRMFVLGGTENYYFGDDKSPRNDVWSSADGSNWRLETADAGWSPRAYHAAAVLNDRIYVFGGGNYVPKYSVATDVWSSGDGIHWRRELEQTPWPPRLWFSSVVYRDRMWVLGGWSNNPSKNWGDVWHSRDGVTWNEFKSPVVWKERHEHSAYVFQDKLWIAGGHALPLSNEVWSLDVPEDWFDKK
jgi:Kelch motif